MNLQKGSEKGGNPRLGVKMELLTHQKFEISYLIQSWSLPLIDSQYFIKIYNPHCSHP
jgi:hypothetical protein